MQVHEPGTSRPRPVVVTGLALLLAGMAGCADDPVVPTAVDAAPNRSLTAISRGAPRHIVAYASDAAAPSARTIARAGARLVERLPHLNAVVVENARSTSRLAGLRGVTAVMPSLEHQFTPVKGAVEAGAPSAAPTGTDQSDAFFFRTGRQWNLDGRSTRANEVWAGSLAGAGVNVCIIDSGIDETHQEVRGKVVAQISFILDPGDVPQGAAIDSNFHGTHVATTVTTNGVALASVAPDASLLVAKVFNGDGGGATTDRVWNAIFWCTDNGADVINMSLGFRGGIARAPNADFIAFYQLVVNYAMDRGVVVVSSSGNDNRQLPHPTRIWLPAELDGVINVGATGPVTAVAFGPSGPVSLWPTVLGNTWDRKAFYSNYGTGIAVVAPGGRGSIPLSFRPRGQGSGNDAILAACASAALPQFGYPCAAGTFYIGASGTSMASPHVAGLAALLRAEIGGERSAATAERVRTCIAESTDDVGPASTFGGGRIDVAAAMALLAAGEC